MPDLTTLPPSKPSQDAGSDRRFANLDTLRAWAIVSVVLLHMHHFEPWHSMPWLDIVYGWWSGVDGFFVLSGILIGGLWFKERDAFGNVSVKRFWGRRWLRTIPPYLIAIHLSWLVLNAIGAGGGKADYNWRYLLFIQNYTGITFMNLTWSLCVEEHFYLLLPLLLPLIAGRRALFHVMSLLAFFIPLVCRLLKVEDGADGFGPHYYQTHCHMEGLVAGVWLAYALRYESTIFPVLDASARILAIPAVVFIIGYQYFHIPLDWTNRYAFTVLALAFAMLSWWCLRMPPLAVSTTRAVGLIAGCSYSLYLTHTMLLQGVGLALAKLKVDLSLASIPIALGLVLLGGWSFSLLFERTAIRLRDRYLPRR